MELHMKVAHRSAWFLAEQLALVLLLARPAHAGVVLGDPVRGYTVTVMARQRRQMPYGMHVAGYREVHYTLVSDRVQ